MSPIYVADSARLALGTDSDCQALSIEPITPPNQVCGTASTAALIAVEDVSHLAADFAGMVPLARSSYSESIGLLDPPTQKRALRALRLEC